MRRQVLRRPEYLANQNAISMKTIAATVGMALTSWILLVLIQQSSKCPGLLSLSVQFDEWGIAIKNQWQYFVQLLVRVGIFLFGLSVIVMMMRILNGRSSPATVEDPTNIAVLNLIIRNTLEQSFVFFVLLASAFYFNTIQRLDPKVVANLGVLFVLSQLIFALLYWYGTNINFFQLRTFGFTPTLLINLILAQNVFSSSNQWANKILFTNEKNQKWFSIFFGYAGTILEYLKPGLSFVWTSKIKRGFQSVFSIQWLWSIIEFFSSLSVDQIQDGFIKMVQKTLQLFLPILSSLFSYIPKVDIFRCRLGLLKITYKDFNIISIAILKELSFIHSRANGDSS